MITPAEIEAMPLRLERYFKDLEKSVMLDIVRKLKKNGGEMIPAADWQMHRLRELGASKIELRKAIQIALRLFEAEIDRIYSEILSAGYARDEELYKAAGVDFIPYEDNAPLQQLVSAVKKQTADELKNITGSLGFAVKQPDGTLAYHPVADFYQKTLDKGLLGIAIGAFDYNTVLKRTVKELTDSGMRYVDYASGWSNRVDVAARRALLTGFNQVVAQVNENNAEKLGTNTYEVSWHSGHRPSHWWGGQWFTHEELESVCGLGEVDGLCGANCYHSYTPVIPGVSIPTYTKEQLAEMEAKEAEKKEYDGKSYTKYEALQRQRRLETRMRAQRQKIKLLEEGSANEDDITAEKAKYRATSDEYARFSEAMNLPQQRDRVTVDGLRNIGNIPIKTVENPGESGIINSKETFNCEGDYLRNVMGSAKVNNPKELKEMVDDIISKGGNVIFLSNSSKMVCNIELGKPATIEVDENISLGGFRHEYRHFLDDYADHHKGIGYYLRNKDKFFEFEKRGYEEEIKIAQEYKYPEIAEKILLQIERRRREIYGE